MVPTLVAILYPKVASVLGLIGSFAGLIIVYILPVITYLKKVKTECENPILA
jgi:Transmembrane amino acid transporter protein